MQGHHPNPEEFTVYNNTNRHVVLGQGRGRMEALQSAFHNTSQQPGHISMAFYQWLWSFDGWNSLSQVTEELKNSNVSLQHCFRG